MITLEEQLAEVQRELGTRRYLYPQQVRDGKMGVAEADYRIEVMAAVRDTLLAQSIKSRKIGEEI